MNSLKKVNYSDLFLFEDPFSNRWLRLSPISEWVMENDNDRSLAYGEQQPPEPVTFHGYMGGPIADILWTGLPPLFCVSELVVKILKENKFTGWSIYPVIVQDRKGKLLPNYYGFAVTSYAGKRDLSRSPIIKRAPYVPGGSIPLVYKGFFFDETAWDGSDIFRVHPSNKIVTRALKDAFVKANIRNVRFLTLADYETDTIVYKKFGNKQD